MDKLYQLFQAQEVLFLDKSILSNGGRSTKVAELDPHKKYDWCIPIMGTDQGDLYLRLTPKQAYSRINKDRREVVNDEKTAEMTGSLFSPKNICLRVANVSKGRELAA